MKKIAILAFALCLFSNAKAEDNLQFVPVQAAPGASGSTIRFDVQMFKDSYDNVSQLQFDVVVPDGMTLDRATTTKGLLPSYVDYDDDDNEVTRYYHSLTCENIEGNLWRITVTTNSAGKKFNAGNGIVARVRYKLAAGMAEGVYPVKISNVIFSGTDGVAQKMPASVSYITVGSPKTASLALEGEVPSLVNAALAKETVVSALDLSEVTSVQGQFDYVVGRSVVAPAADVAVKANLKAEASADKFCSFTMPFDYDFAEADEAYVFDKVNGSTASFVKATSVKKGDVVLFAGPVEMVSTRIGDVAAATVENDVYYVHGAELWHGNNITVPSLRGVWSIKGANSLRIALGDVITGMTLGEVNNLDNAYDLQGRQVQSAKNGVFVVNGKKQIVK